MYDPETIVDKEVIKVYTEMNQEYHFKINMQDEYKNNLDHIAKGIRDKLMEFGYSEIQITDMLVKQLYGIKKSKNKEALWFCYGDIIYDNLKRNLMNNMDKSENAVRDTKKRQCIDCGEWFEIDVKNTESERCPECYKKYEKRYQKDYREDNDNKKKKKEYMKEYMRKRRAQKC